jgi:hypothetical protein
MTAVRQVLVVQVQPIKVLLVALAHLPQVILRVLAVAVQVQLAKMLVLTVQILVAMAVQV